MISVAKSKVHSHGRKVALQMRDDPGSKGEEDATLLLFVPGSKDLLLV